MPPTGFHQSPILIERVKALKPEFPDEYLRIDYVGLDEALPGTFEDLNFDFDEPYRHIIFDGKYWDLRRIHIHTGFEHKFDGEADSPDMEVHLVHFAEGDAARTGAKVVIGVHFKKDEKVVASESGLGKLNKAMKVRQRVESFSEEVAPAHFLPGHPDRWYRYDGSLTSGPAGACVFSEDVSWFVMAEKKLVNPSDVDELEKAAAQKPRGLQDLNHRIVLRSFDLGG